MKVLLTLMLLGTATVAGAQEPATVNDSAITASVLAAESYRTTIATVAAQVQAGAVCPVNVTSINANWTGNLLNPHPGNDPWEHYLRLDFVNRSDKPVVAIRFEAHFIDAFGESTPSQSSYDVTTINLKPGGSEYQWWGDGVYFNAIGWSMTAEIRVEKIKFGDDTVFVNDGKHLCDFTPKKKAKK